MKATYQPGALLLLQNGPLIPVVLRPKASALKKRAQPKEFKTTFLIDTGADQSSIQRHVAVALGLRPVRSEPVFVGLPQIEECPVYRAELYLTSQEEPTEFQVPVMSDFLGLPDPPQPLVYSGLLGRDVLVFFELMYRGKDGIFSLSV